MLPEEGATIASSDARPPPEVDSAAGDGTAGAVRVPPALRGVLAESLVTADTAVAVADAADPELPLVWVNRAFEAYSGYPSAQLVGRNARLLQGPDTDPAAVAALGAALRSGRSAHARVLNHRPDGTVWWNDMHVSPVRDATGTITHWLGLQHDITDRVRLEEQLAHAATHDGLTGLLNRATFTAEVERELARGRRDRRAAALLVLDIDGFKSVNDTHGHAAGDDLLVQIGARLTGRLRAEDAVARLGGDEFMALVVDLTGDGVSAVEAVVRDLSAALAAPFHLGGVRLEVEVSTGVALHPRDGATATTLIAAADIAMYRAKNARAAARETTVPSS